MSLASTAGLTAEIGTHRRAMGRYSTTARVFHWLTVALVVLMVTSAVIGKQLNDGPWSDTLFTLHKVTGLVTLTVVLLRLCYRLMQWRTAPQATARRRAGLHWTLYATVIMVPLVGWSGISAFGSLEILPGLTLPAIWPKDDGHADVLFMVHAYLAFTLLALVVLHIGVAMQDYMMRADDPVARD